MPKRPYKEARVPGLIPYITVGDAKATLDFYQKAFGFELMNEPAMQDGKVSHVEMKFKDTMIMFAPEGAFGGKSKAPKTTGMMPSISLYVYCDDVDAFYERATKNGAKGIVPPADMFWGDRMCQVVDLDGHIWCFARNVSDHK